MTEVSKKEYESALAVVKKKESNIINQLRTSLKGVDEAINSCISELKEINDQMGDVSGVVSIAKSQTEALLGQIQSVANQFMFQKQNLDNIYHTYNPVDLPPPPPMVPESE